MGTLVSTLAITVAPESPPDLEAAHEAVQVAVWKLLDMYVQAPEVWAYCNALPGEPERFRHVSNTELGFGFSDHAGCTNRSQRMAVRWFRLALSAARSEVEEALSPFGVKAHRVPPLREVLDDPQRPIAMKARDKLWVISSSGGDEIAFMGDDEQLESPTAEELLRARELLLREETEDDVENMLRPNTGSDVALTRHLAEATGRVLRSGIWYVSHSARPSDAMVAALFAAGARELRDVVEGVATLSQHADLTSALAAAFESRSESTRAVALAAVPGQAEQGLVEKSHAAERLLEALTASRTEQSVAAEFVGRMISDDNRARVADAVLIVLADSEAEDEARHGAALTLVNAFLRRKAPERVLAALEVEAASSAEWSGLAEWFVEKQRAERG